MMYVGFLKNCPLLIPLVGSGKAMKRMVWVHDIIAGLRMCVGAKVTLWQGL